MKNTYQFFLDESENINKYVELESADLVILDPPYGIGKSVLKSKKKKWKKSAEKWDDFDDNINQQYDFYLKHLKIILPVLKKSGRIIIFGSYHNIYLMGEILQRQLSCKISNSVVWNKIDAMYNVVVSGLIEGTEYMIWAHPKENKPYFDSEYARSCTKNDTQLRNVWSSPKTPKKEKVKGYGEGETTHPHQKPFWLYERLIRLTCPEQGLVVDPMAGSGVTAKVCLSCNRYCVLIENDPSFYERTKQNLNYIIKRDIFFKK